MGTMKIKIILALVGAGLVAAGCVGTVTGHKTGGMPFVKDSVEGHYEKSVDAVFQSAKEVLKRLGSLTSEGALLDQGTVVKTVEGKVNGRNVYVRVEATDANVTSVTAQARGSFGTDVDLAHEVEKEISLQLVGR